MIIRKKMEPHENSLIRVDYALLRERFLNELRTSSLLRLVKKSGRTVCSPAGLRAESESSELCIVYRSS